MYPVIYKTYSLKSLYSKLLINRSLQGDLFKTTKTININNFFVTNCLQELEKPPPDPLYGLRIHSWVLVLHGKREVPESFFVEPFTGLSHPVDSVSYLGIESVWNHVNYWVNMQDCSEGVKVGHLPT